MTPRTDRRLAPPLLGLLAIRCIARWAPEHAPETVDLIERHRAAATGFERAVARHRLTGHVGHTLSRAHA